MGAMAICSFANKDASGERSGGLYFGISTIISKTAKNRNNSLCCDLNTFSLVAAAIKSS
jgi:hypothetical protein